MWRRTYDAWGFSPLKQINRRNVATLRLAWARGLEPGLQEGTPLVHDGTMYFPNYMNVVQAIDAASGDLIWEYRHPLPGDLDKYVARPGISRTLAMYGNVIFGTASDGKIYALDAGTGKLVWETAVADYRTIHHSSGPLVADGRVISGRGCSQAAGPDACVITAHDPMTGRELWRTRTIARLGEIDGESWGDIPDAERRHVGSWLVPSYDPALRLIYFGTSVTSPTPKFMLAGNDRKYLYHNSTLALDVDTGRIVWHYQHLVDDWDLDHAFERILIDTTVAPDFRTVPWINPSLHHRERRPVVTGIPGKSGIVYTLDRRTGEFLWARPTVYQNVVRSIDGTSGEVEANPDTLFRRKGDTRLVCPGQMGGKNWQAGAYSPLTGLMYMPLQNACARMTAIGDVPAAVVGYAGLGISARGVVAPGESAIGTIHAIDVSTGTTAWTYRQRAGTMSLLATGGGLLFGGDVEGRFRAFDQKTGRILWEVNLGAAVTGYPIAYAVNGQQYVAVSTGQSVASGGIGVLAPELKSGSAANLFVFSLP